MSELVIGDLTLKLPIIQGGMGVGVSKASLATAVSAAGGLGVVASVGLGEEVHTDEKYGVRSCKGLQAEIRKVKEHNLPVGVNIMVALTNYESLVRTCVEENVDVIISGAGLPLKLPQYVTGDATKLVPIVSSARAAQLLCKTWLNRYKRLPDAIVVEGPLAGGHLGFSFELLEGGTAELLETTVSEVIAVVAQYEQKIPVIAAGGIYTGEDIARFLKLGAGGVQMGTRFVATEECDASDEYKQAFLDATQEDIVIIKSPVGMPARVISNEFVKHSQAGEKISFSCPYKCLISCNAGKANYCIADALLSAARGDFQKAFAMCGANAFRIDKIVTVKELMDELVLGAGLTPAS